MLGGSDRLGREKMSGRDDVTDWCFYFSIILVGRELKGPTQIS